MGPSVGPATAICCTEGAAVIDTIGRAAAATSAIDGASFAVTADVDIEGFSFAVTADEESDVFVALLIGATPAPKFGLAAA